MKRLTGTSTIMSGKCQSDALACVHHCHLFLLARCSRYFAFCIAEPEPCAPVMYFFFFALVFTFPSSCFGRSPPLPNDMPLTKMS